MQKPPRSSVVRSSVLVAIPRVRGSRLVPTLAAAAALTSGARAADPGRALDPRWSSELAQFLAPNGADSADSPQEPDKAKGAGEHGADPKRDERARVVDHSSAVFRADPAYPATFSFDEQRRTYDKAPVETQRPLLELGRELYVEGPLQPGSTALGEKNLVTPGLMIYGDWRTAAGYSDNGGREVSQIATRLNLDVNLQITATERVHAFFRPLDKDGKFTRYEFDGGDGDSDNSELILDFEPDTLFFEGDAGAMAQGFSGEENKLDFPFAVGKIPLLIQNGVWMEDAFWGGAFSIPASNSRALDISNYDVTFFVGLDDVTNAGVLEAGGAEGTTRIIGATGFFEVARGYSEIGYGYTTADASTGNGDYHNLTASFTKRYADWLSNSVRVIWNVGQDLDGPEIADGVLLLVENSFRTREPYTLIPYLNLFAGFGTPQSLARDAGAGGVLKNTGINFETNALTALPKLDDTGHDAFGGALGVEYLFDLVQRRQLVFEIAGQHPFGDEASAPGDEFALGARYQMALNNSWILRFDAMAATISDEDDLFGFAVEIRKKF